MTATHSMNPKKRYGNFNLTWKYRYPDIGFLLFDNPVTLNVIIFQHLANLGQSVVKIKGFNVSVESLAKSFAKEAH